MCSRGYEINLVAVLLPFFIRRLLSAPSDAELDGRRNNEPFFFQRQSHEGFKRLHCF